MTKKLLLTFGIVSVFSLGAAGGIWAQAFLLPYLSSHESFRDLQFVQDWSERTTVIQEVQEITITQEPAVARVVEKGEAFTVGITSTKGAQTISGSGVVMTSDGFIITVGSVVPEGYTVHVYTENGNERLAAQVLKRDMQKNLAIVKVEQRNFPSVEFARANSFPIGDTVVMVGKVVEGNELVTIAQQGTIRTKNTAAIRTNIIDKPTLRGSPLFALEGRIVGVSTFEPGGRLVAIPVSVVREFSGF